MPANKKDCGIIYRCPACLNNLNDVIIDMYEDGMYRCVKCGYNATPEGVKKGYADVRARYKLLATRITLDEQRKM